ncbi:MAG: HAMP domain-containing protein, partial [Clostridia bacterium]|nr:HAMP domain-containing protein [Clostridia bacterium]
MKSVFFRRLLATLTICILLASAIMVGGYTYLIRDAYVDIKLEEMQAKAALLRQLVLERVTGGVEADAFNRLSASFMEEADAAILIVDGEGRIVHMCIDRPDMEAESLQKTLSDTIARTLAGESVASNNVWIQGVGRMLVAGAPIEGQGGVLLLKSAGDVSVASRRLSILLLWVALVVVPVTLFATLLRVKRETGPLYAMSEAAISMSKGDFGIRLNEDEPGEMGVLSRALNNLCETLSGTIYQLRFEKGQLNEILQSLTDGVVALDGSGSLTHCNSALMRMFGAVNVERREDISEDEKLWTAFDEVFETEKAQTITYPMPGDRMLWITVSPVVNEDGSRNGVVGLFKDMTEMERLEATRREYVANVSHELRTPLTAVRGLLEPLADGMVQDEESRQRYYKTMLHEVMRLSRLITDMMTLSRLQSGAEYVEITR